MTIESTLYDRVTGYAGVSALIGTRMYPGIVPKDGTLPCIVYRRAATERLSVFVQDVAVVFGTFEFDSVDTGNVGARALAEQVRAALQRWSNGTTVEDVFLENETDDVAEVPIKAAQGSDSTFIHVCTQTYRVNYTE